MNIRNWFASFARCCRYFSLEWRHAVPRRLLRHRPSPSPWFPTCVPSPACWTSCWGRSIPHADILWESVATISGPKGVEERQPRTDKEWAAVRTNALLVIEGANMLMVEGRKVAHPGQQLEEPGGATDYTPAQAQAEIDKDRPAFVAFAHALQDAAASRPDGHREA